MLAGDWFTKRERLAVRFGFVDPQGIPPEAVWFLDDRALTDAEVARGVHVAAELARERSELEHR